MAHLGGFFKRNYFSRFKKGGLNKKQKLSLLVLIFVLLLGGVLLRNKLATRAESDNTITNSATLTYTDSQGQPQTITSNIVTTTITGSFYGVVIDKNSNPVADAVVSICRWGAPDFLGECTRELPSKKTDVNGAYIISEPLEEGAYSLSITTPEGASEYLYNLHRQYVLTNTPYAYNATLRERPILGGRIKYHGLLKALKSPTTLTGVSCALKDAAGDTKITKISDVDGNFNIYSEDMTGLQYDTPYTLWCSKDGYTAGGNPAVILRSGQYQTPMIEMKDASTPATINITAKDSTGKIFTSIYSVAVTRHPNEAQKLYSFSTGPSGLAIISSIPTGDYTVRVNQYSGYVASSQEVTLTDTNLQANLVFTLNLSASISGEVTSADPANTLVPSYTYPILVQLLDGAGTQLITTYSFSWYRVGDSVSQYVGRYKFSSNLAPGTYKVRASAGKHLTSEQNITINSSSDRITSSFSLASGCLFSGTVKDRGGTPLDYAKVEFLNADSTPYANGSDKFITSQRWYEYEAGRYELSRNIPAGNYKIRASIYGYEAQTQDVSCATSGQNVIGIDFTLTEQGAAGAPAVSVEPQPVPVMDTAPETITQVSDTGAGPEETTKEVVANSATGEPIIEEALTKEEKQEISSNAGVTLSGTVVDSDNNPVPSAVMTILDGNKTIAKFKADINGKYSYRSEALTSDKTYTVRAKRGNLYAKETKTAKTGLADYEKTTLKKMNIFQRLWQRIKRVFGR